MLVPTSVFQLAAVLLLVVPGIVYTAVRRRLVGPTPEDQAFTVRLTRAVAVSVLFDVAYVLVAGPWLINLATPRPGSDDILSGLTSRPRMAAAVALLLLIVLPTAVAAVGQLRLRGPLLGERPLVLAPIYHPAPSAWDLAARDRGNTFVRVFTEDGYWVGGWFGTDSYVSTYPQPRDIFIEQEWKMSPTGDFLAKVPDSFGVFLPLTGKERVAWVAEPTGPSPRPLLHRRLLSRLQGPWRP